MQRLDARIGLALAACLLAMGTFVVSCQDNVESPNAGTLDGTTKSAVRVPAGSVDALAAAITAAGPHGKVILEAGLHTESAGVTIAAPVKLQGEAGAVLQVDTAPSLSYPAEVEIAILIREANGTEVSGLEIVPADPIGGTAIAIQRSAQVTISNNTVRRHQYSIVVQRGDNVQLFGNTLEASTAWMTGDIPESDAIDMVNGRNARITGNRVTGATLGIFTSDADGIALKNSVSGCFVGMILCCVPEETFLFPDGDLVGADRSATGWLYQDNVATNNLTTGILAIDDANNNTLINNTGSGNGTYDIEMANDSMRFGFLTPRAHDNVCNVGNQPNLIVQNCGENNVVRGTFTESSDACEVVP